MTEILINIHLPNHSHILKKGRDEKNSDSDIVRLPSSISVC